MLKTLVKDMVLSEVEDDDIENVEQTEPDDETDEFDREAKSEQLKSADHFVTDFEDRLKTLFIRVAKSYGFINSGDIASDFVDNTRKEIKSLSNKLKKSE